jgi:hypothetical protein
MFFDSTISKFLKQTLNNQPLASSSTLDGFSNFTPYVEILKKQPLPKKCRIAMAYQKLKVTNKKCE